MNILVTGCMGFIGAHTVIELTQEHTVIGLDNISNKNIEAKTYVHDCTQGQMPFHQRDVRSDLSEIFTKYQIDTVVHLAAAGSVTRSFLEPIFYSSNNEGGFVNLVTHALRSKTVKKIIYASSSSVYGPENENVKHEQLPLNPASPYAYTKVCNEKYADIFKDSINFIGLRFFNVYGPLQSKNTTYSAVIPTWINNAELQINGNGNVVRDFTYVKDVTKAIKLCLEHHESDIFNVGTGIGTSLNQLAQEFNKPKRYASARPKDTQYSIADIGKINKTLGYQPLFSLKEGLKETIKYYENKTTG